MIKIKYNKSIEGVKCIGVKEQIINILSLDKKYKSIDEIINAVKQLSIWIEEGDFGEDYIHFSTDNVDFSFIRRDYFYLSESITIYSKSGSVRDLVLKGLKQ